jgi:hypothetical protein
MTHRTRLAGAALGLGLALAAAGPAGAQPAPPTENLSRADLRGRALDVRVRCETDTTVHLKSRFGAAREAAIACRDGAGRARLRLTAREAARAAGAAGLEIELSLGTTAARVLEFRKPAKRGANRPLARSASSGGYWTYSTGSCTAMSGVRHAAIATNGDQFDVLVGTYVWVSPGLYTYNPARGYQWVFYPWQQLIAGWATSFGFDVQPNTWVKPVLDVYSHVYGHVRNWVRTTNVLGGAYPGTDSWCYFA